jgi:hypothetical protein
VGVEENIYDKLIEYLGLSEDNINILEQSIDTNVQLEYFEFSRNLNSVKSEEDIIRDRDILFDSNLSISGKKLALVELASLNNIEAYRTIEKYLNQPNINLYDWACLALQESKLNLETSLLDESKALITTGLGGKGLKLRYFIVLFSSQGHELTSVQKEIIQKELNFFFSKYGAELEDVVFDESFASILAMVPIKVHLQKLFKKVIFECNQIGNFLFDDFIITNIKTLSVEEIRELLMINNIY